MAKRQKAGGRKAGTPNKRGHEVRELLSAFVRGALNELPVIWLQLKPSEKMDCLARILPYVTPKLETMSFDAENNTEFKVEIKNNSNL